MIALRRAFSKSEGVSAFVSLLRSQPHPSPVASNFTFSIKKDNPLLQLTIEEISLVAYHKNQAGFSSQLHQLVSKLDKKSFREKERQLQDIRKLKGFEQNLNALYLFTRLYCRNMLDNPCDYALIQYYRTLPLAQIQRMKNNDPFSRQIRWLLAKFQSQIADHYLLRDQSNKQVKSKNPLDFVEEPVKVEKATKQVLSLDKSKQLCEDDIERLKILASLKAHTLRSLFICQQNFTREDSTYNKNKLLRILNLMNSTNLKIRAAVLQILQAGPPEEVFEEAAKFAWRCGDINQLAQQVWVRVSTLDSQWAKLAISFLKERKLQFEQTKMPSGSDLINFITKVLKVKGFEWSTVRLTLNGKICVYLKDHDFFILPAHHDELCRVSRNLLPETKLLFDYVLKSKPGKASLIRQDKLDQCQNYSKKKSLVIGSLGAVGKFAKQRKSLYGMDEEGGAD